MLDSEDTASLAAEPREFVDGSKPAISRQETGLGETRRKALLKQFGSLRRLRAATVDEIVEVPGVGRRTAQAVVDALAQGGSGGMAVNMSTGEILDDTPVPQRGPQPDPQPDRPPQEAP